MASWLLSILGSGGAAGANGAQPPDISKMTPEEAAIRLYNRVMGAHERGQVDTVQMFAPMAITAYQMLVTLNVDQHYDVGRIAARGGSRRDGDIAMAIFASYVIGQFMPLFYSI